MLTRSHHAVSDKLEELKRIPLGLAARAGVEHLHAADELHIGKPLQALVDIRDEQVAPELPFQPFDNTFADVTKGSDII